MLRIVLIDDERSAITLLKHKLLKNFPEEIEIVVSFESPEEALLALPNIKADILFLDVEMPGISGLELLERLGNRTYEVVFTTAYPQYAIAAIRGNAFDYLVKPIDEADLKKAIERALEKKYAKSSSLAKEADLLTLTQSLLKAQSTVQKLSVPTSEGLLLIPIADIVRLEGSGSYATIHTLSKQKVLASKNLSEFEDLLAEHPNFFRTHKSHLINLNHVDRYMRGEGGSVIMSDGSEVEVARRRKEDFLQRL
jgi:two-component system, LytTR family, response regulator